MKADSSLPCTPSWKDEMSGLNFLKYTHIIKGKQFLCLILPGIKATYHGKGPYLEYDYLGNLCVRLTAAALIDNTLCVRLTAAALIDNTLVSGWPKAPTTSVNRPIKLTEI
jgi:hypothetical protein